MLFVLLIFSISATTISKNFRRLETHEVTPFSRSARATPCRLSLHFITLGKMNSD